MKPNMHKMSPPTISHRGFLARLSLSGCALKRAIKIKTMSAITAPKSTQNARLTPFVMLVSTTTKKTGPVEKTSNNERGTAAKSSLILWGLCWGALLFDVAAYGDRFNKLFGFSIYTH